MKIGTIPVILVLIPVFMQEPDAPALKDGHSFFVGTYTNDGSEGIYSFRLHENGTLSSSGLASLAEQPSFLAKSADNKYLVAVNEIVDSIGTGYVESFVILGEKLKRISRKPSGGGYPCFVTVNSNGYVLTANYEDGTVGLLRIDPSGVLSEVLDIQKHSGKGTTSRQEGPHAHSVWFGKTAEEIISLDLGTNDLWFSGIDTTKNQLVPSNPAKLAMADGAGPRHLAFHPGGKWAYVLNELSSDITMLERTGQGIYKVGATITTLPKGYSSTNTCADIHASTDGKFLYASNRGHDSIAIFKINPNNGNLLPMGHTSTKGRTPRNFSLSPDENFLLVANQDSNSIVSFKRNHQTGSLEFVDEIAAPTPVCILF